MENTQSETARLHFLQQLFLTSMRNAAGNDFAGELFSKPEQDKLISEPEKDSVGELFSKPEREITNDDRLKQMIGVFKHIKNQLKDGKTQLATDEEKETWAQLNSMNASLDQMNMSLNVEGERITSVGNRMSENSKRVFDLRNDFKNCLDKNKDRLQNFKGSSVSESTVEDILKAIPGFEEEMTRLFLKHENKIEEMLEEADVLEKQIDEQAEEASLIYGTLTSFFEDNKELILKCSAAQQDNEESKEKIRLLDIKLASLHERMDTDFKIFFKRHSPTGTSMAGFFKALNRASGVAYREGPRTEENTL